MLTPIDMGGASYSFHGAQCVLVEWDRPSRAQTLHWVTVEDPHCTTYLAQKTPPVAARYATNGDRVAPPGCIPAVCLPGGADPAPPRFFGSEPQFLFFASISKWAV